MSLPRGSRPCGLCGRLGHYANNVRFHPIIHERPLAAASPRTPKPAQPPRPEPTVRLPVQFLLETPTPIRRAERRVLLAACAFVDDPGDDLCIKTYEDLRQAVAALRRARRNA